MAFDPPRPGQVINYRYLWSAEHRKGHQEGAKERPTAVVYTADNAAGKTRVYVLPITHSPPTSSERSVELLPQWKKHLGLDERRSWIVASEMNHFEWPGADVRGRSTAAISHGFLPHKVTTRLREMIRDQVNERTLESVNRDVHSQVVGGGVTQHQTKTQPQISPALSNELQRIRGDARQAWQAFRSGRAHNTSAGQHKIREAQAAHSSNFVHDPLSK